MTERDITFYDWNEPVRPSETHETAPPSEEDEGAESAGVDRRRARK